MYELDRSICPGFEIVLIHLTPVELSRAEQMAERREAARNYRGRSDQWGKGHIPNASLRGNYGELAFSRWSGLPVDESYYRYGDQGRDFVWRGWTVQVKTTCVCNQTVFVETKRFARENWHFLVWCEWHPDRDSLIRIIGWQWKKMLQHFATIKPAMKGDHQNLVMSYKNLLPMKWMQTLDPNLENK